MRYRGRTSWGGGETCRDVCMFEFAPDNQKGGAFYTIFTTNLGDTESVVTIQEITPPQRFDSLIWNAGGGKKKKS